MKKSWGCLGWSRPCLGVCGMGTEHEYDMMGTSMDMCTVDIGYHQ